MNKNSISKLNNTNLSRRRFVLGMTSSTLLAGMGFAPSILNAAIK